jgi:hypothetical protein
MEDFSFRVDLLHKKMSSLASSMKAVERAATSRIWLMIVELTLKDLCFTTVNTK